MVLGFSEHFKAPGTLLDGMPTFFERKIIKGRKIHTIRHGFRWKAGVTIHAAHGVRTANYRCFFAATCTGVEHIVITRPNEGFEILVNGEPLSYNEQMALAINDGFDSLTSFLAYFKDGLDGQIVHWTCKRYAHRDKFGEVV